MANTTIYTYIKKDIPGFFIDFEEQFDPELYNNLGTTYDDFWELNLWVLLSPEQQAFHYEHPDLGVWYVWNMELPQPEPDTPEKHKQAKIEAINAYDTSNEVNALLVNGEKAWLTPDERSNYRNSIEAAQILGVETLTVLINGTAYTMPTAQASQFLAQIQLYADNCYLVTQTHIAEVNALETIEEIDAFDEKAGYPDMLSFVM